MVSWSGDIRPAEIRAALNPPPPPPPPNHKNRSITMSDGSRRATGAPNFGDAALAGTSDRKDGRRVPESRADVLIMTALGKELRTVVAESGLSWDQEVDPDMGLEFLSAELGNGLRIALAGAINMGPVSAAVATSNAITAIGPSRVILTGIAAGIGDDVKLGDIVVSDQIVDYDAGKLKGGGYAPRWRAYPSDPTLVKSARLYRPSLEVIPEDLSNTRPDHSDAGPEVHVGTILAGSKVVADAKIVDALRATWSQAVGLEMEGGGGAAASHEHHRRPTFIIVKGVCDRADVAKNDAWQEYAAIVAARYTIALLSGLSGPPAQELRGPAPLPPDESIEPWRSSDQFAAIGITPRQVQTMLKDGFSMDGLLSLCVDLGIDWEDLPMRSTKTGAVASIVEYCRQRAKVDILVAGVKEANPGLFK